MKIHFIFAIFASLLFAQPSSAAIQYEFKDNKVYTGFLFQVPDYIDVAAINGTWLDYNIPGYSGTGVEVIYYYGTGTTILLVPYGNRYFHDVVSRAFNNSDFSTPGTHTSLDGWATLHVSVVPEPAVWATMLGGFGMLGAALRRRRQRATPLLA